MKLITVLWDDYDRLPIGTVAVNDEDADATVALFEDMKDIKLEVVTPDSVDYVMEQIKEARLDLEGLDEQKG